MNTEILMPITKKIYNTLMNEKVKETEVLTVLRNAYHDLEMHMNSNVTIEETYFNMLKDIVWYNFERKNNLDTLKDFGSVYKYIAFCCEEDNFIPLENIESLRAELKEVRKKLDDKNVLLVQLMGNEESFNLETKVHFLDKRKQTEIPYTKKPKDAVVCIVKESLNAFKMEHIKINAVIDTLLTAIDNAEKNKTRVIVGFI